MKRSWMVDGARASARAAAFGAVQETSPLRVAPPTVNAVWVEHEVNLNYTGSPATTRATGWRDRGGVGSQGTRRPAGFKVTTRGC